jgi:hypothetical protein
MTIVTRQVPSTDRAKGGLVTLNVAHLRAAIEATDAEL